MDSKVRFPSRNGQKSAHRRSKWTRKCVFDMETNCSNRILNAVCHFPRNSHQNPQGLLVGWRRRVRRNPQPSISHEEVVVRHITRVQLIVVVDAIKTQFSPPSTLHESPIHCSCASTSTRRTQPLRDLHSWSCDYRSAHHSDGTSPL